MKRTSAESATQQNGAVRRRGKARPKDVVPFKEKTRDDQQKRFIVELVACYRTPSQVVEAVREEFGIELPRQSIEAYDPTKAAGRNLSQEWRDVFFAARTEYVQSVENIGVKQALHHLEMLQAGAEDLFDRRDYIGMAVLLKQAAKQVGGIFTKRR